MIATPGEYANRVYWNAGVTPGEYLSNTASRNRIAWAATWQLSSAAPPGNGEWFEVARVTIGAGPVISAVTDYRMMFFEGRAADSYADLWGDGAFERTGNRALVGIHDFHTFTQAMRRQLKEIIGAAWYTVPARTLTAMAAEHNADGTHANVTAETLLVRPPMSAVHPLPLLVDGRKNDLAFSAMAMYDPLAHVPLAINGYGLLQTSHCYDEDFHYRTDAWTSYSTCPPSLMGVVSGGGSGGHLRQAQNVAANYGGAAELTTNNQTYAATELVGPNCWRIDANNTLLRFRARYRMSSIANVSHKLWLTATGWQIGFYFNAAMNANWRFTVGDGVHIFDYDTGVAAVAGSFVELSFAIRDASHVEVHVAGMSLPVICDLSTASISLANPAVVFSPYASVETAENASKSGFLDRWTIWDDVAIRPNYGREF
jgi:hypothetical protein